MLDVTKHIRFGGPPLALAQGVEAIRQVARGLAQTTDLRQKNGRGPLALRVQGVDQVLGRLPDGESGIGRHIPVLARFVALEQMHLAGSGMQETYLDVFTAI